MTTQLTGVSEVLTGLAAGRAVLIGATPAAVHATGIAMQYAVRENAGTGYHRPGQPHIPGTGPGPNVGTGDYRRMIQNEDRAVPGVAVSETATDAVQANRLEHGFVGQDSAGRNFVQVPYPHWEPAAEHIAPIFDVAMDRIGDQSIMAYGGSAA